MKKSITLLAAAGCLGAGAYAQDTLFSWNIFNAGDRIVQGHSNQSLAQNVVPGSGGLGQTWVFTTVGFEYLDTTNISPMGWVPSQYTTEFPQSNFAFHYGMDLTRFDFVHANGTGLYVDGTASQDPNFGVLSQVFSDPVEYMRWPMYYGITFSDTGYSSYKYPTTGPFDSAWEIVTLDMNVQVDGQGTLITSYGTYDILRIRRDVVYWIQYAAHDPNTGWTPFSPLNFTGRMYEWWTDSISIGWMVASVTTDPTTDSVQSYAIMTDYAVNVPEYTTANLISLYPNPAADFIFVSGEMNLRWEILDMSGRTMSSGVMRNKTEEIDIAALASGIYLMQVTNEAGVRGSRKFVVQ